MSHTFQSGIHQVEAEVQGQIDQCWYKVLFAKIITGTLCIVGGLSLGVKALVFNWL
ncbi:MAG: chloride channel protein [Coprobacillus cateniformis]|uniref:chloride channel protein n=1 Tax=Coprobacillus cateniformis TaxID=100884 RepID=UPI003991648E